MALISYDASKFPDVSVWEEAPEPDGPPEPLPSEDELRRRTRDLLGRPKLLQAIQRRYGLTNETLAEYEVGFEERWTDGPWIAFPIRDVSGELVNVRRRYFGPKQALHATGVKYRNLKGRGEPQLYPANRLPSEGERLLICCGEFDALVARQVGIAAVTSTGGAHNWPTGWGELAERFDVTMTYDRGEEPLAEGVARRLGFRVHHLPAHLPVGTDLAQIYVERGPAGLRAALRPRLVKTTTRRK